MNNVTVGVNSVPISTNCVGSVSIYVDGKEIELDRRELREFLARTVPQFIVERELYRSEALDVGKLAQAA